MTEAKTVPRRRATITVCYTVSSSEDEVDTKDLEDVNSVSSP